MCTSMTLPLSGDRALFGRTLDLDAHFGERPLLTPRRYPLVWLNHGENLPEHYALLGMAATAAYPLYAEAMNERGLCMAGLRFSGNARYADHPTVGKVNLAPWELIPYLLGKYATVNEVRNALREICVIDRPYDANTPAASLHWHIADGHPDHGELVLEITSAGMRIYDNPVGVLANNPPFFYQLLRYTETMRLSNRPDPVTERERKALLGSESNADPTSLGEGGWGLPGDYSSHSRFVRAATLRRWVADWMMHTSAGNETEGAAPVNQFFRVMASVSPMAGTVLTPQGMSHRTLYTCCMDGKAGRYFFATEEDPALRSVGFSDADAEGKELVFL